MKRPTRVKIGAHTYKIRYFPEERVEGRYVGVCLHRAKLIKIAADLPKSMIAQTLLHEIMHAIYYEWGLTNSEQEKTEYVAGLCPEENAVNGLSLGLSVVFRDNPKLLAYIRWCLC